MVQVSLTAFETYFESSLDTLSNVTTIGALNSGSITSGFGAINNGSSAITTTGTITYGSLSDGTITVTAFVDEDNMSSNSATLIPTQQSVKAYVDAQTSPDLDITTDSGTIAIDLSSETLTVTGGTGINSSATGNAVTLAVDSTVATLTGSQTFTNKVLTSPDINTPDIDGGTIDSTVIGGSTAAAGSFTTVSVDNITIDGTEIDLSSGDLTLDVAGDINLDAAGNNIIFKSAGTHFGDITKSSNDLYLNSVISDGDVHIRGNDGGSTITALQLDMSEAGAATFNDKITAVGTSVFTNLDISGDIDVDGTANLDVVDIDGAVDMASTLAVGGVATFSDHIALADSKYVKLGNDADFILYHDGTSNYVQAAKQDSDIILRGNDGGSGVNMLTLDTSAAGLATFNAGATFGDDTGIGGTATAGYRLDVMDSGATLARIRSTADSDVSQYFYSAGTTATQNIYFGDTGNTAAGGIRYYHNGDNLTFTGKGAGTEMARFNSSGQLGIGTTSPGNLIEVAGASPIVEINSTSGSPELQFSDGGTDEFSIMYDTGASALKIVEGGVGTHVTILDGGNVGIGSTNPQNVLDLGSATAGRGIAWGYTNGTAHYNTIWSEHGTASIVVGAGLKGSTSASTFLNPYTGTYGYAAIELDSFSDDGIKFYAGADASRTKDDAITPSEVMRIATNGTVGIGTTAPAYTLDVDSTIHIGNDGGAGYTQSRLIFDADGTTRGAGVYFHNQANDVEWFAGNPYTSSDSFDITRQATTSHAESTATHSLALMTIDGSTGNLGIGLASPTSRLHVNDDTNDGYVARFSQDNATGYGVLIDVDGTDNTDPALVVNNAAGTTGLYVSQAGNVGIGNTTPTQKLDVNGTVELNNLTVGGAQGSDGQVLTSTGSGVAWEDASGGGGGGGAWTVISNSTVSSAVSTLEFTSITGYTHYMIDVSNLKSSGNKEFQLICAYGGSASYTESGYVTNKLHTGTYSGSAGGELQTSQSVSRISKDMSDTVGGTVQLWFGNSSSTISFRSAAFQGTANPNIATGVMSNAGTSERDAAITKIKFSFQSGNIDEGNFTLYGLATS